MKKAYKNVLYIRDPDSGEFIPVPAMIGEKGPKGDPGGPLYIAYSETSLEEDENTFSTEYYPNTAYIGICMSASHVPQYKSEYEWHRFRGDTGEPGSQGPQGPQGNSVWIKYSEYSDGASMSDSYSDGMDYMGICIGPNESDDSMDYTWVKIKGDTGETGGTGPTGPQGNSVWIKYASSAEPTYASDNYTDSMTYMGVYTGPTKSETLTDYTWLKIRGNNGSQGPQGNSVWIAYSNSSTGANWSTVYKEEYTYIGIARGINSPSNGSDYTWMKINSGPQGDSVWIKYSQYSDGHNPSDTYTEGMAYMGVYIGPTKSTNYLDYTWLLIRGNQGLKGNSIWIAYADDNKGTRFSTTLSGHDYIGFAEASTRPTNWTDYSWTYARGYTGNSAYFAYSTEANGGGTFSTNYFTNANYIGVAVSSSSSKPSTADSYKWFKIRGETIDIAYASNLWGSNFTHVKNDTSLCIGFKAGDPSDRWQDYAWFNILETVSDSDDPFGNARTDASYTQKYIKDNYYTRDEIDALLSNYQLKP